MISIPGPKIGDLMAAFNLRMDNDFKAALEKIAKQKDVSVNQLIVNYLRLGKMIDSYTIEDSQVMIKNAKGFPDETVIVPVQEIVGG